MLGGVAIDLRMFYAGAAKPRYIVYQGEIGAEGTYHYQGYVEYDRPVRMTALKKVS